MNLGKEIGKHANVPASQPQVTPTPAQEPVPSAVPV